MATTEGKIDSIFVNENFCCIRVLDTEDGNTAFIVLWSYFAQEDNAKNRLTHGMYLSLVRDAWLNNRKIIVSHSSGSALATQVQVT